MYPNVTGISTIIVPINQLFSTFATPTLFTAIFEGSMIFRVVHDLLDIFWIRINDADFLDPEFLPLRN